MVGEPPIDEAIAYEERHASAPGHAHAASTGAHDHEPLVSRGVQSGAGLLTATVALGLALGGLFALVFALVYGRAGRAGPTATALWLGAAAFVVVVLVPFAVYPASPPGVGAPETLGERTLAYLAMIAISVLAAVAAVRARVALLRRATTAGATAAALALYGAVVVGAGLAMPPIDEVPPDFPATTLWDFRVASLGTQLVLWGALAAVFAAAAARVMTGRPIVGSRTTTPEVESA